MSGCIPHLSILHSPVFLLNSCLDLFSAPYSRRDPFSRSYRVNLPSSLTTNHSSALVYSTRSRVSVYGTGDFWVKLSGFSWRHGYVHCQRGPKALLYCQVRLERRTLLSFSTSTPFNRLFRQPAALSLPRLRIALKVSDGMLTVSSIGCPQRVGLRTRLTLIRLALIRKP